MAKIVWNEATINYLGREVFRDFSAVIEEGEHVCIQGPVASGKTMLLKTLNGTARVVEGDFNIFDNGKELIRFDFFNTTSIVEFAKSGKYFNPGNHFYQQRYHHNMEDVGAKSITVGELLKIRGVALKNDGTTPFVDTNLIHKLHDKRLIQLSSGQRRKLQLVLSIRDSPEVLLLDQPYLGLDTNNRKSLNEWLWQIASKHNLQLIMVADKRDAPPWIERRIVLPHSKVGKSRQNRELGSSWKKHKYRNPSIPLIELQGVEIKYQHEKVLNDLNWKVKPGERIAIVGKNGAGKSTLISLLNADNPKAYSNYIKIFGTRRGDGDSIWDVKSRIGFISPEMHLYFTERMSCYKVIATGFFDTKFMLRKLTKSEELAIESLAEYFEFTHLLKRDYQRISLGEQKIILFIRALVKKPELLLMDEPYQGFDQEYILRSNRLLNLMASQLNTTIIFITHHKEEIPDCVSKFYELDRGKLRETSKSLLM